MKGRRLLLFSLLFVLTVLFAVPAYAKPKLNKKAITITPRQQKENQNGHHPIRK